MTTVNIIAQLKEDWRSVSLVQGCGVRVLRSPGFGPVSDSLLWRKLRLRALSVLLGFKCIFVAVYLTVKRPDIRVMWTVREYWEQVTYTRSTLYAGFVQDDFSSTSWSARPPIHNQAHGRQVLRWSTCHYSDISLTYHLEQTSVLLSICYNF